MTEEEHDPIPVPVGWNELHLCIEREKDGTNCFGDVTLRRTALKTPIWECTYHQGKGETK